MQTTIAILFACVSCSAASPAADVTPNQFTVVSWNVDSGDADPHLTALRIATMKGVDLWGLTEVRDERWATMLKDAAEENRPAEMTPILGPTGGAGRSLILYDARQFELIRWSELGWENEAWYKPGMPVRPVLIAQLRHRATRLEFIFAVNRFHPQYAAQQAVKMNEWAARQTVPIIAVGSYYFQYCVGPRPIQCEGQKGLQAMAFDGVFQWIKPENLVKTFDHEANTIEDFIFTANALGKLQGRAAIVVEPGDFPSTESTSDHRPVRAAFTVLTVAPDAELRERTIQDDLTSAFNRR